MNQVICGRITFIPSIWMCAVEHRIKSTMLDGKLIYSIIETSQEKIRCLLEYCIS